MPRLKRESTDEPRPVRKRRGDSRDLAEIVPGAAYPIPLFKRKTGIGDWGFRTARKEGLPIRRAGGKPFVLGSDFLEYLARQSDATEESDITAAESTTEPPADSPPEK
jgi:hypothetical protein